MYQPYQPSIFFDPTFVTNVIAGWMLTVVGALLLLLAAVWFVVAGEWLRSGGTPTSWRALCTIGLVLFLGGWLWQIVGYYRVGALTFAP